MAHCDGDDVETLYPGITDGLSEETVEALCENASDTIDHFILAPVTEDDTETIRKATALQVIAYIQTGDLQQYGLKVGTEIVVNGEKLIVGQYISTAAKRVLANEGLTTPWGV